MWGTGGTFSGTPQQHKLHQKRCLKKIKPKKPSISMHVKLAKSNATLQNQNFPCKYTAEPQMRRGAHFKSSAEYNVQSGAELRSAYQILRKKG